MIEAEAKRLPISELLKQLRQTAACLPGGIPLDPPELPHTPVITRTFIEKDTRTPDQIKADEFLKKQSLTLANFLGLFATMIRDVVFWDWSLPKKPPE